MVRVSNFGNFQNSRDSGMTSPKMNETLSNFYLTYELEIIHNNSD